MAHRANGAFGKMPVQVCSVDIVVFVANAKNTISFDQT